MQWACSRIGWKMEPRVGRHLRAAQYNLMIKQLTVALDPASTNLSLDRQKELRAALDWFHVDALYAVNS